MPPALRRCWIACFTTRTCRSSKDKVTGFERARRKLRHGGRNDEFAPGFKARVSGTGPQALCRVAETPARYSRIDRRLAEDLYHKQIAFEDVETAMYLAIARRLMRDENAPP